MSEASWLRRNGSRLRRLPVVGEFLRDTYATGERLLWTHVLTPVTHPTRVHTRRLRIKTARRAEILATRIGTEISQASRRLLLLPHRSESIPVPPELRFGDFAFDVVDDLEAYTKLPRARVIELLQRRHENFRTEWHSFPRAVRDDHWYYLSARTYLFANASHLHNEVGLVEKLVAFAAGSGRVLDFGGGTGNLALSLAASGHATSYLEVSALQKDFVRFRAQRHGLEDRLEIIDWWKGLSRDAFDVVFALDVLEHLPDLRDVLEKLILPALKPTGSLVEVSPFVRSLSNPMHYEQEEMLDAAMRGAGFGVAETDPPLRVWRRAGVAMPVGEGQGPVAGA